MRPNQFGLLFALLLAAAPALSAQKKALSAEALATLKLQEDTLGLLAYAIVNDSLPENRFGACRAFIPALVRALKADNSFDYPFARLQSISIQYPQDSSFRIFTFHLYVDDDTYRYYGAIQVNSPDLRLYPLIDRSAELQADREQAVLTSDRWYGGVYYNIHEAGKGASKHYLLFGYNGQEKFRRRKFVDVLTFDAGGKPVLGAPVFVAQHPGTGQPMTRNRLVFEYSSEASIRLNYDATLGILIYDHLQMMGGRNGEGPVNIPDGTYEGYEFKNGKWHHIDKVFDQVMDEAPRPYPVLDGKKRSILGKER